MEELQPRKSVRDELADKFISILESEQPLQWTKGWTVSGSAVPYNGATGRRYNGINRLVLMFKSMERGYDDPRFYTFHQVSKMEGCKVMKDSKAIPVEYWMAWDSINKKNLTMREYNRILKTDDTRSPEEFRIFAKTAYVFNAAQIEGLKPLPQPERNEFVEDRLAEAVISTLSENMGIPLIYGGSEAYYSPGRDEIHLPHKETFLNAGEFYGTALHELGHSTGAPTRLDRPMMALASDRNAYAVEELRAEIASTFVCSELGLEMPDSVIENHLAYVSSWLQQIKEDHNVLFSAIKDADKIADYLIDQGRVEILRQKLEIESQMPTNLDGQSYEIWQLKDTPENEKLQFTDYAYASLFRLTESRYEKIYEAAATRDTDTLDKIFVKYNIDRPADFKGHSLSMSDVVVLNDRGKRTAWYCDQFGFQKMENFIKPERTEKRGISI